MCNNTSMFSESDKRAVKKRLCRKPGLAIFYAKTNLEYSKFINIRMEKFMCVRCFREKFSCA